MKKALKLICCSVFLGGSSAVLLFAFFSLLRSMILTELPVLQVTAVVLLLCSGLAYVAGAVLRVLRRRKCNTAAAAAPSDPDMRRQ